ncbi:hypothetical protein ACWKSP_03785 [Micromonosporaceae bacterium Da 78-11]
MRLVYAHYAVLAPGADVEVVTAALDGCHLTATADGDRLHLRILFAAAPDHVDDVRERIDATLAAGDRVVVSSGCARIVAADRDRARLLLRSR